MWKEIYSYFCYIRRDLTRMSTNMFKKDTKGYCEEYWDCLAHVS